MLFSQDFILELAVLTAEIGIAPATKLTVPPDTFKPWLLVTNPDVVNVFKIDA